MHVGTAYVEFDHTKVPVANVIGSPGLGFYYAMANFNKANDSQNLFYVWVWVLCVGVCSMCVCSMCVCLCILSLRVCVYLCSVSVCPCYLCVCMCVCGCVCNNTWVIGFAKRDVFLWID